MEAKILNNDIEYNVSPQMAQAYIKYFKPQKPKSFDAVTVINNNGEQIPILYQTLKRISEMEEDKYDISIREKILNDTKFAESEYYNIVKEYKSNVELLLENTILLQGAIQKYLL